MRPHVRFDAAKLDAVFFPDRRIKSNFIRAIGYADSGKLYALGARLEFDETRWIV